MHLGFCLFWLQVVDIFEASLGVKKIAPNVSMAHRDVSRDAT